MREAAIHLKFSLRQLFFVTGGLPQRIVDNKCTRSTSIADTYVGVLIVCFCYICCAIYVIFVDLFRCVVL